MRIHLNIGLTPGTPFEGLPLSLGEITTVLDTAGCDVNQHRCAQSTTEPTFAADVTLPVWVKDHHDIVTLIHALAVVLRQEAIAWQYHVPPCYSTTEGYLTGPHADAWGEFNPDFFIQP